MTPNALSLGESAHNGQDLMIESSPTARSYLHNVKGHLIMHVLDLNLDGFLRHPMIAPCAVDFYLELDENLINFLSSPL